MVVSHIDNAIKLTKLPKAFELEGDEFVVSFVVVSLYTGVSV